MRSLFAEMSSVCAELDSLGAAPLPTPLPVSPRSAPAWSGPVTRSPLDEPLIYRQPQGASRRTRSDDEGEAFDPDAEDSAIDAFGADDEGSALDRVNPIWWLNRFWNIMLIAGLLAIGVFTAALVVPPLMSTVGTITGAHRYF